MTAKPSVMASIGRILLSLTSLVILFGVIVYVFQVLPKKQDTEAVAESSSATAAPQVVVSIAPLHSLVASVMDGVGTPLLLLDPSSSPHGFALKPSDMKALSDASLIVWVGPGLEAPLNKILTQSGYQRSKALTFMDLDGVVLYPIREDDDGVEPDDHLGHDHGEIDPHLWLDPRNAQVLVRETANALAAIDPPHADLYQDNALQTLAELDDLHRDLTNALAPFRGMKYVVFHDGYQYFEKAYGLESAGVVSMNPELPLSAQRVTDIRSIMMTDDVACIFSEPQFSADVIGGLITGTGTKVLVIDPLGANTSLGSTAYEATLRSIGESFTRCMSPDHN